MLRARERPLERRDQILHRPFERRMNAADTRCGPAVIAIGSVRRLTPSGSERVHPAIDVEQRDALAVDRNLDLLRRLGGVQRRAAVPVQRPGRLVVERHAEPVLAVGGERVHDRQCRRACRTARPRRCSRCEVQRDTGYVASRAVAARSPTASRLISAAAVRYACISVGDSSCASAMLSKLALFVVERQVVAGVDVEREQIADRPRVLGAIQPLERAPAGRRLDEPARRPALRATSASASRTASSGRRLPAGGI